jgi:poly-gamma-glutamate synthesis protein (capsule biosynthesis protein)
VAVIQVSKDGVGAIGFSPAVIDKTNEPIAVPPKSDEGRQVIAYLEECCSSNGLRTRFTEPAEDSGLPAGCVQLLPASGSDESVNR